MQIPQLSNPRLQNYMVDEISSGMIPQVETIELDLFIAKENRLYLSLGWNGQVPIKPMAKTSGIQTTARMAILSLTEKLQVMITKKLNKPSSEMLILNYMAV
ncbi:hypothetical protein D3C81_1993550 [compost metagenome]